jgi:hypothetical protein
MVEPAGADSRGVRTASRWYGSKGTMPHSLWRHLVALATAAGVVLAVLYVAYRFIDPPDVAN